jgi:acyl dehydratase
MDQVEVTSIAQLKKYLGREINIGKWVTVTQQMLDRFAEATGDHYFIHVDPERAKTSLFGQTVAHGFLTLSMLAGFLVEDLDGIKLNLPPGTNVNYGLNKVRFIAPVPTGSRIRLRSKLKEVDEDPAGTWIQIVREQTVEIEGSVRPAMVAEVVARRYFQTEAVAA